MPRLMRFIPFSPLLRTCIAASMIAAVPAVSINRSMAADRVRMATDNVAEIDVKDCVRTAADAIGSENLDAFVGCFTTKQRPQIRRQAAMMFVRHELALDLVDSHLMSEGGREAELAVKYRVSLTGNTCDIVSLIALVREDDAWRISRERVESRQEVSGCRSGGGSGEQVFRFGGGGDVVLNPQGDDLLPADIGRRPGAGCANGRCGLPR